MTKHCAAVNAVHEPTLLHNKVITNKLIEQFLDYVLARPLI